MKKSLRHFSLLLVLLLFCLCGCSKYKGNYQNGITAFSSGDFATAAQIFDECDPDYGNSPTYAAYSHGMVFWEKAQYAEALPYFEQCQGFMYGTQRYQYCKGYGLMQSGSYAEAESCFDALGSFEDAAQMASYCKGIAAELNADYETALYSYDSAGEVMDAADRLLNLQTQLYSAAITYKENGEYDNALILFSVLGDYLNSPTYAVECRNVSKEEKYTQAENLEAEGKLSQAYELFLSLGAFRDSPQRASTLAEQLGIKEIDESQPYADLE